ncbi:DUF1178 family protein [uncultured Roseibium sp.]|uniref:DUF1178 family protein n=1 Tax=uncultured Roseibium sp. TaxID=1936171 RepID=UPI00262494E0|nr:DUF1178 family protein [uncultured Roseibium sp.]
MIKYTLVCNATHSFEGWFRNSDDFEAQCGRGLVTCPICGSTEVRKGLMAPAVSTARKREAFSTPVSPGDGQAEVNEAPSAPPIPADAAPATRTSALLPADLQKKEIVEALRVVRAQIIENSENVGSNFAKEARKIHYGEAEERNIYGQTTPKDAEALMEEGIAVVPLPDLPDDKN